MQVSNFKNKCGAVTLVIVQPTFPLAFISMPCCFQILALRHVVEVLSELRLSVQTLPEVLSVGTKGPYSTVAAVAAWECYSGAGGGRGECASVRSQN